jgi:hypothetical protein
MQRSCCKESPSPISWHAGGMVDGVVPWASGVRNVFIQIVPHRVTGRVVVARSG